MDHQNPHPYQLPPQNLEAEESIICSILVDNSALAEVLDIITPEDFYKTAHQKIFQSFLELHKKKESIDLVTVVNRLRTKNQLEEVGGATYIASLLDTVPLAPHPESYAKIIHEKACLRKLIEKCNEISRECFEDRFSDFSVIMNNAKNRLSEIDYKDPSDNSFITMEDLTYKSIDRYEERYHNKDKQSGVLTGFHLLDHVLGGGFQPTDLIILAARPAMGKSAWMSNVSDRLGKERAPHAIFSLEMSDNQLYDRKISAKTGINLQKFRTGNFSQDEWHKITDASAKLYNMPIYIDPSGELHYSTIRRRARRLKEKHGIKLIFVDYLQLIRSDPNLNLDRELTRISNAMKNMAKELELPVVVLSQLNRELEKRPHPHKRPRIADIRGCLSGDAELTKYEDGLPIKIKNVTPGDIIMSMNREQKIVPGIVTDLFHQGKQQLFIVKTSNGLKIKATSNHPFFTENGFIKLEDLKKGDLIGTALKVETEKYYNINNDFAYFVGLMIGNGSYLKHREISFTDSRKYLINDVKKIVKKYFPKIIFREKYRRGSNHLYFSRIYKNKWGKPYGNELRECFREMGIFGQINFKKRVPKIFFNTYPDAIRSLLFGLIETDGCVKFGETNRIGVHYDSSSLKLAHDVRNLLLKLGVASTIHTSIRKGTKKVHRIYLSSKLSNLKMFFGDFKPFGNKTKKLYNYIMNSEPKSEPSGLLALPVSVSRLLSKKTNGWRNQNKKMNRHICKRWAEKLNDDELRKWADSDLLWDKIISIKKIGSIETYDIRVEGHHCFLANNFIVHNSGMLEADADVIIFIYRHEHYLTDDEKENHPERGIAEFNIAKHRNGPTGMIKLHWREKTTSFHNIDTRYE